MDPFVAWSFWVALSPALNSAVPFDLLVAPNSLVTVEPMVLLELQVALTSDLLVAVNPLPPPK